MNRTPNNQSRILAVSLSARGIGYAVMEGKNSPVDYGNKVFQEDKNAKSLDHIEKLIVRYQPDVLVLPNVNVTGTRRAPRIKELHRKVVALAKRNSLKVAKVSNAEVRIALLNDPKGTKQEMADLLAKQFPDELASRLPPKRRDWESEDARMDMFDAVALAVVFTGT